MNSSRAVRGGPERALALGVGLLLHAGCRDDAAPTRASSRELLRPVVLDGGSAPIDTLPTSTPGSDERLLGEWCDRAGTNEVERGRALGTLALAYVDAQKSACVSLTRTLSEAQQLDWSNYLIGYTQVLAGCVGLSEPPPGGIRVFGLANTAAVGVSGVPLSAADVDRLISLYVPLFVSAFALSPQEAALLQTHLSTTGAATQTIPGSALSACAQTGDAGG